MKKVYKKKVALGMAAIMALSPYSMQYLAAADSESVQENYNQIVKCLDGTVYLNKSDRTPIEVVDDSSLEPVIDKDSSQLIDDSSLETIDDSSLETIDDSSLETIDDSSLETIDDSSLETIDDSSLETIDDSSLETIDDSSLETIDDSSLETIDDSSLETIDDSSLETIDDSSLETINDQVSDYVQIYKNSRKISLKGISSLTYISNAYDSAINPASLIMSYADKEFDYIVDYGVASDGLIVMAEGKTYVLNVFSNECIMLDNDQIAEFDTIVSIASNIFAGYNELDKHEVIFTIDGIIIYEGDQAIDLVEDEKNEYFADLSSNLDSDGMRLHYDGQGRFAYINNYDGKGNYIFYSPLTGIKFGSGILTYAGGNNNLMIFANTSTYALYKLATDGDDLKYICNYPSDLKILFSSLIGSIDKIQFMTDNNEVHYMDYSGHLLVDKDKNLALKSYNETYAVSECDSYSESDIAVKNFEKRISVTYSELEEMLKDVFEMDDETQIQIQELLPSDTGVLVVFAEAGHDKAELAKTEGYNLAYLAADTDSFTCNKLIEAFSNIYLSSEGIIYSIKYQDGEEGLKASIDKVLSYDYKKNNYIKYQHEPLELTDIYDDNFLAAELAYEKILDEPISYSNSIFAGIGKNAKTGAYVLYTSKANAVRELTDDEYRQLTLRGQLEDDFYLSGNWMANYYFLDFYKPESDLHDIEIYSRNNKKIGELEGVRESATDFYKNDMLTKLGYLVAHNEDNSCLIYDEKGNFIEDLGNKEIISVDRSGVLILQDLEDSSYSRKVLEPITMRLENIFTDTLIKSYYLGGSRMTKCLFGIVAGTRVEDLKDNEYIDREIRIYGSDDQIKEDSDYIANGDKIYLMDNDIVDDLAQIIIKGDVNSDGKVNVLDMQAVQAQILGIRELDLSAQLAARSNKNYTNLNVTDLMELQKDILSIKPLSPM